MAPAFCIRLMIVAAALSLAISHTAHAEESVRLKAKYVVSLSGLKIGELRLTGKAGKAAYDLVGTGKISGLPQLFTTFKGKAASKGAIAGSRAHPSTHSISYNTVKKDYSTRMAFSNGVVTGLDLVPPYKAKRSRVPIKAAHKAGVIDPVSAIMLPVEHGQTLLGPEACNRTVNIFDGRERFDMRLVYKGLGTVKAKTKGGYAGGVVICQVNYTPIAGHRRDDTLVKKWSRTGAIEAWFVPVPEIDALVFYRGKVPTPFGTAVIHPKAFLIQRPAPQG